MKIACKKRLILQSKLNYSPERKIIVITDWFAWSCHKLHLIERHSVQSNKGYIVHLQASRVHLRSGGLSDIC